MTEPAPEPIPATGLAPVQLSEVEPPLAGSAPGPTTEAALLGTPDDLAGLLPPVAPVSRRDVRRTELRAAHLLTRQRRQETLAAARAARQRGKK